MRREEKKSTRRSSFLLAKRKSHPRAYNNLPGAVSTNQRESRGIAGMQYGAKPELGSARGMNFSNKTRLWACVCVLKGGPHQEYILSFFLGVSIYMRVNISRGMKLFNRLQRPRFRMTGVYSAARSLTFVTWLQASAARLRNVFGS